MRHYLGAALLKSNQPEAAEAVYRRDLRWNQNNGWALFGLHQALIAQGKSREAEAIHAEWQAAWAMADVSLSASHL
jgi:Tfp pilus assembly protein PilF